MGVDYTAEFGIGFQINMPTFDELEEMDLDTDSYLDGVLTSDHSYFETGSGDYSGEMNDYYVVLDDDSIDDGLMDRCEKLRQLLLNNHLIGEDDKISVVGGLNIW